MTENSQELDQYNSDQYHKYSEILDNQLNSMRTREEAIVIKKIPKNIQELLGLMNQELSLTERARISKNPFENGRKSSRVSLGKVKLLRELFGNLKILTVKDEDYDFEGKKRFKKKLDKSENKKKRRKRSQRRGKENRSKSKKPKSGVKKFLTVF